MGDLCDVAQVMWLDRIERQFLADRAVAANLAAAGVADVSGALAAFGTIDDARDEFLQLIDKPLERSDRDERADIILAALGASRAR